MSDGVTMGTCLCGAVRVTLSEPVTEADACHCSMCRRIGSGGPMFAIDARARPAVDGMEHVTLYRSSDWAERAFCSRCGTSLWYHLFEPEHYSVAAGLFDPAGLKLTKQIFIDDKPDLYDLAGDTPRHTGAEVIAWYTEGAPKAPGKD